MLYSGDSPLRCCHLLLGVYCCPSSVCVYVCTRTRVCVHVCSVLCRPEMDDGCPPWSVSHFFFQIGSVSEPGTQLWLNLAAQTVVCLGSPSDVITGRCYCSPSFSCVWAPGMRTWVLISVCVAGPFPSSYCLCLRLSHFPSVPHILSTSVFF